MEELFDMFVSALVPYAADKNTETINGEEAINVKQTNYCKYIGYGLAAAYFCENLFCSIVGSQQRSPYVSWHGQIGKAYYT